MAIRREKLLQQFEEEYKRLNPEQRLAVDQTEGPVMVIAGPGTGKTQILSARIGKILLSDAQLEPSNILCLTYTDAGVVAMRRRLTQFIGPDAYRVHIHTFHAFCNDVIQENLSLFEKTSLDPISDLERIELLKELIDGFEKDHPLKRYRGDVYYEIRNLQSLFSLMKREGWSPDFICEKVEEYIADLPNRDEYICKRATKEFKKGDVRLDKIEEQRERMSRLQAACSAFQVFQTLMRQRDRYDFDDMINWVIDAFGKNENLLRNYQEQYQYILVDEYQDTSGSQNKIVELLINFWDKPNVFVVGDDDQSIYRFQGASIENMHRFATGFGEDLITVVLTANYRSTQPILDISKSLIDRNSERLVQQMEGLSKNLLSSHDLMRELFQMPIVHEYDTPRDEMIHLVLQVEKLLAEGTKPGDIGIIYKENKYGDELANYFRLKSIPFYTRRNLNILDQPIIRQLLLVLNYLAAEHDTPYGGDEMLFEILHFDWFDIPPVEIAKASVQVAAQNYKGARTSLRQWICEQAAKPQRDLFDTGLHKSMCEAVSNLEKLVGAVPNHTLQSLLEKVIREGGFLSHIINHTDKNWLLQLITGFYNHVRGETSRHPTVGLLEFMDRIALMRKEGLVLPLVQVAGNEKGINLMTAHGSKGLEFDTVFFVGCASNCWEKKKKPFAGFAFPDTLFSSGATANDVEELRRLFYVALTRAKRHLYISYSNYAVDGKPLEASQFLAEIAEDHHLPRKKIALNDEVIAEFSALHFTAKTAPEVAHLEDELTARLVSGFVMNVSALNNFLKCPLEFYFRNIVRIPSPKNEAMEFGSAVHHALEHLFQKMQAHPAADFPPLEDFLDYFGWYMRRHRASFTREQFNRRMEYGMEILKNYYLNNIGSFNKVVTIERNFRNVVVDDMVLKGKLDKIEFSGREAAIVDYKTGDPDKSKDKFLRPNTKQPAGGDYWRQAVFYKIMVEHYSHDWTVASVEFDFIEPDKKGLYHKEKVTITPMDVELVKEQIKTVHAKIMSHDFYTGCGGEDCHWCNFVKTTKLTIALHELQADEPENVRMLLRTV